MSILKPVRILGVLAVLATVPLIAANAQAQTPSPAEPGTPPAATLPDAAPMPQTPLTQKPTITPTDRSVAAPTKALIGLAVFSADGSKLGAVHSVDTGPDGKVTAIRIKTGGFLGLGAKLVAIPEGKFSLSGDHVQLGMSADEVSKLPKAKDQS
jgi:hypothetical protein